MLYSVGNPLQCYLLISLNQSKNDCYALFSGRPTAMPSAHEFSPYLLRRFLWWLLTIISSSRGPIKGIENAIRLETKQSMIMLKHTMWVKFLSPVFHILSDTQSVEHRLLCFIQWETHCNAICFISTYLTNSGVLKFNWWPFAHRSIFWHHQICSKNVSCRSLLTLFNTHSNER